MYTLGLDKVLDEVSATRAAVVLFCVVNCNKYWATPESLVTVDFIGETQRGSLSPRTLYSDGNSTGLVE